MEKKFVPEETKTETKKETKVAEKEKEIQKRKNQNCIYISKDRTINKEEFEKYDQLLNKKTTRKKKEKKTKQRRGA